MPRRTDTSIRLARACCHHLRNLIPAHPSLALNVIGQTIAKSSPTAILSMTLLAVCGSWVWSQSGLPVPPPRQASPRAIGQAPGLESFAVPPESPAELMEAISYLTRVGRTDQAIGLAKKLNSAEVDDETLLEIREIFGSARLLQLQNSKEPQLNSLMTTFITKINKAVKSESVKPERVEKLINALSATREEREVASEKLARLGSLAIGPLVDSYDKADPAGRKAIQSALNKVESTALPALVGVLRHPKPDVVAAVAQALGHVGDPAALPVLAYLTTRPEPVRTAALDSYAILTGGKSPADPAAILKNQARQYLDRDVYFSSNQVELWFWNTAENRLEPKTLDKSVAEGAVGYRLARLALDLNPADVEAQTLALSILLQEEIDRLGPKFPAEDPAGIWAIFKASGPDAIGRVLSRTLATGKHEQVGILAIKALGEVMTTQDLVTPDGKPGTLARAVHSMDRRIQFEAARTLVDLAPEGQFPGSSTVVPALARFLQANPVSPRAVIVHNNLVEGSDWVSYLRNAGYDP
ncbi:MAG: HEAT repeat domain-containing protein, partial [Isosphaeraceae bacterium]